MTKRIFQSILLVTLASLAVSLAFFTAILFPYFENRLADELAQELAYLAPGAVSGGSEYLRQAGAGGNRLTLIAPDGSVLFDTTADPAGLENHADRQEVQQALAGQAGRSVRYSKTLDKKTINCALLLSDGNVLRVSSTQYTGFALLLSLIQPMLMVLALTAVLAGLYAYRLSRRLTRPLNEIDLEHPQPSQAPYEELAPLLRRLAHQKRQIKSQMQELQRQQQQFEAITENMQEGFLVLDAAGSVLSHNSGAARLLNLSSPPTGKNALELGLCEEFSQPVRQALSGDHVESLIPLHGRQCQLFANPVFQGDQLAGTVLVLVDVTEQQQREALRREFSANVSHELKTPLTSISGIAEIMRGGLVPPGDVPHFAGKIYDESQRLIQLVQDILRLSQLDEDSVLEKPQPVDLMACLRRAGLIDESGRLLNQEEAAQLDPAFAPHMTEWEHMPAFLYDPAYPEVFLTQKDVREVQLAKGAIAAGILLLEKHLGIPHENIRKVYIAGAFGNYMDPKSACDIGLLPYSLRDRVIPVGNAAGEGAKIALLNVEELNKTVQLMDQVDFLELAALPQFQDCFIDELEFPKIRGQQEN